MARVVVHTVAVHRAIQVREEPIPGWHRIRKGQMAELERPAERVVLPEAVGQAAAGAADPAEQLCCSEA